MATGLDDCFAYLVMGIVLGIPIGVAATALLYQFLIPHSPPATHMNNEEVLEWVDWKGRQRKAVAHRTVKENVE